MRAGDGTRRAADRGTCHQTLSIRGQSRAVSAPLWIVTPVPWGHAGAAAPALKIDATATTRINLPIVINISSSRVAASRITGNPSCESAIRPQKIFARSSRIERAPENKFCADGIRAAVGCRRRLRRRFPILRTTNAILQARTSYVWIPNSIARAKTRLAGGRESSNVNANPLGHLIKGKLIPNNCTSPCVKAIPATRSGSLRLA